MVMDIIISIFLLFVGIAILVTIHICTVGRAFNREFFGSDGLPIIKGAGLSVQDFKKLPAFEYSQSQQTQTQTQTQQQTEDTHTCNSVKEYSIVECSVCLEPFKRGDHCRLLPNCHHFFHAYCVDAWLMKSPFCPICRTCTTFVATMLSPKVGSADMAHQEGNFNHHVLSATTATNYVVAEEVC